MTFNQFRGYTVGLLKKSFLNKTTLDKLSTSENGNLLFNGEEIKGGGAGGSGATIYDLTEQVVGCWTNQKPLYQITIENPIGESLSDIDEIVKIEGIVKTADNSLLTTNYYNQDENNDSVWASLCIDEDGIITFNGDDNLSPYVITVQYTKITDEEGSFDPRELPNTVLYMNVDFSNIYYTETEKVVGCWINGKPIYQRVTSDTIEGIELIVYEQTIDNDTGLKIMRYTKLADAENSFDYSLITNQETITDDMIAKAAAADKI